MMNYVLNQYLELLTRPGKTLHPDWWDILNMKSAYTSYFNSGRVFQNEVDLELRSKRNFLLNQNVDYAYLPEESDIFLLKSLPNLERLITFSGLVLLKCPDYLYLKEYRTLLMSFFSNDQLNQLHIFWLGGNNEPCFDSDLFLKALFSAGMFAINVELRECRLWPLIAFTLPVSQLVIPVDSTGVFKRIKRMERFL
ncbi:hypothetical protein D5952_14105 [Salmonella enterica subsp. enterica]|nr:hypothetical protein [Salmonella enterica subsp. enterica serovar Bonn]EBZ5939314.1 hypothetical protein [Salmonella enterica subsp. enterica serovar Muenchen]MLZ41057.1 hypothetical protein [Salmonella enterica subsp. enterica serovar Bonn]